MLSFFCYFLPNLLGNQSYLSEGYSDKTFFKLSQSSEMPQLYYP